MISNDFLKSIPENALLYIFGAGRTGKMLYSRIRQLRSDIQILGFIDSYKDGSFMDLQVFKVDNFLILKPKHDVILIASVEPDTIEKMISKVKGFNSKLVVPAKMTKSLYSIEELKLLGDIKGKLIAGNECFQMLIDARVSGNFDKVHSYYNKQIEGKRTEYFENIDIKPGDIIIDGGTFDGYEACRFAELAGVDGKVFTFDPWGGTHIRNRSKFELNKNIIIVKRALWEESRFVYFSPASYGNEAGAFVSASQDGSLIKIKAVSIDDFIKDYKVERIDFIKMDIEGSEPQALIGAKNTIQRFKPDMAICVYHDATHFYRIPQIILEINQDYYVWFEHYSPAMDESVMYFSKDRPILYNISAQP